MYRRVATGLLPASLDRTRAATVLISHPQQDHYELLSENSNDWPVWTGEASARPIGITGEIASKPEERALKTWNSRSGQFAIGPFKVTPLLTDHSAFAPTCCSSEAKVYVSSTHATSTHQRLLKCSRAKVFNPNLDARNLSAVFGLICEILADEGLRYAVDAWDSAATAGRSVPTLSSCASTL